MTQRIIEGQKILGDVATLGLASTKEPLEQWGQYLNPDKQRQMYDSLTDHLAEVLVMLD